MRVCKKYVRDISLDDVFEKFIQTKDHLSTMHHKIETLIHCNSVEEIKHRLGYEGAEAPKRFIDLLSKETQKIFEESVVEVKS